MDAVSDFLDTQPEIPSISIKESEVAKNTLEKFASNISQNLCKTEKIAFNDLRCTSYPCKLMCFGEMLKNNTMLEIVKFTKNDFGSYDFIDDLANGFRSNASLEKVSLKNNFINDKIGPPLVESVLSNPYLKILNLSKNKLGPESAKTISAMLRKSAFNLTTLNISYNQINDDGAVFICESLHKNDTLQILDLEYDAINNKGAAAISDMLKYNRKLIKLQLGLNDWNKEMNLQILVSAQSCLTLLELGMQYNDLEKPELDKISEIVYENKPKFDFLEIAETQLTDPVCSNLGKGLKQNKTLETFVIWSIDELTEFGLNCICNSLISHPKIVNLHLLSSDIGDDGAAKIADFLKNYQGKTLEFLELDENRIHCDGAIQIADSLCFNNTLKILSLKKNQIGLKGARSLARMLSKNTTLDTLYLGHNMIGSSGTKAIAGGILTTNTLKLLDLESNHLNDIGAKAIADSIMRKTSVEAINLGSNEITEKGGIALFNALVSNTELKNIDLTMNLLGDNGARECARIMKKRKEFVMIELDFNRIHDAVKIEVEDLLSDYIWLDIYF